MPKIIKHYRYNDLSGCVTQVKNRKTKGLVGLYSGPQSGMETEIPWVTVCEQHHTCVCHYSLQAAYQALSRPDSWCEPCAAQVQNSYQDKKSEQKLKLGRPGLTEENRRPIGFREQIYRAVPGVPFVIITSDINNTAIQAHSEACRLKIKLSTASAQVLTIKGKLYKAVIITVHSPEENHGTP